MFWGEHAHQLDIKGRLIIPARYRTSLDAGAILTRGLDKNLVIYPQATWQRMTEQLSQMSMTQPTARALRRLLFSGAVELSLDKQGRMLIPRYLRDYAALEEEVLLIGMETFIEIWEPERWRVVLSDATDALVDADINLTLSL